MSFGWDYPPGVSGNEPQITGEWPCPDCGGFGSEQDPDVDEDGNASVHVIVCERCKGTGVDPEDEDADA